MDAREFLAGPFPDFWQSWARDAPDEERASRRRTTGEKLRAHAEAILLASCEDPAVTPEDLRYLPYNLRLAGELIYEEGEDFEPGMLGDSSEDLQERFLRHLDATKKRALQCLALAIRFDQAQFGFLVEKQYIAGFARQDFIPHIVASRAYVEELEPGVFRFHRHMQKSLLDDLSADDARAESARPVIEALVQELSQQAAFARLADFNPAVHLPPYQHAMEILTAHAESGLLGLEPAARLFNKLEEPF